MNARRISLPLRFAIAAALVGAGGAVLAQGDNAPAASAVNGGNFEVGGVQVDVTAKDAESARHGGWRLAQRKAWATLSQRLTGHATELPDSTLDGLVSGILIEHEEIGPTRYIARLGVQFERSRAAAILGVPGQVARSAPMLLIPVEWSGGAGRVFERESPWKAAWARFRAGGSAIDYVRPAGNGPDSLLLNVGQAGRRGRNWWRTILDQYGASDILVPEVQLRREWPGGPIVATFFASHGPDHIRITQFTLRVENGNGLDALLDAGVKRIDQAYQEALASGRLKTDRLLATRPPSAQPEAVEEEGDNAVEAMPVIEAPGATAYIVQVETPSAAAVTASEASVRTVPGVRSAVTTSLALGGISVMRVTYAGEIGALHQALEARGWIVQEGPGVLRIHRPPAPQSQAPGDANGG